MIKKIHQLSKDIHLEDYEIKSQELLKKHNPDYEYKLWTDEELEKIIHHHPQLQQTWSDLVGIHKSDLGRYLVLYLEGGYYCDTDFYVSDGFDNLSINDDIYFVPSTKDFLFMKDGITNYFIYTPPKKEFFILLIDEALKRINTYNKNNIGYISSTSGKILIDSVIKKNNLKINSFSNKDIINKYCFYTDTTNSFGYHDGSTSRKTTKSWVKGSILKLNDVECNLRQNLFLKGNLCQIPVVVISLVVLLIILLVVWKYKR